MRLDPLVRDRYPELMVGYAIAHNVKVERFVKELDEEKQGVAKEAQDKYALTPILEIPEIKAYREFYKVMNVDPTKIRPPTEYLLRKAIAGRFPSINNLVDSCLLASVKHWAIVSVYDLDKVRGTPVVTLSKWMETFQLIDGRMASPTVAEVVLRDDEKILTAYAMGDAKATMVTPQTKNALIVAWNAPGISQQQVEAALNLAIDYAKRFCQATIEKSEILT
ncbi:MAG: phenylalanyl-tRNA synthetase subunit beta [Candidatus Bathyarchaeota archaeon BA1]|nr:MAG: phenylalanyl-tRNA synthetase subunit beta [Candidatus Bathyarchaeota archaeon BA1]